MEKRTILTAEDINLTELYLLAYDPIQKIPRIVQILEILPEHKALENTIICKFLTESTPQYFICKAKDLKRLTAEIVKDFKDDLDILISTVNKMSQEYSKIEHYTYVPSAHNVTPMA